MKKFHLLIFLLTLLGLSSCSNRKAEVARDYAQWIGKEIVFPDSMTFVIVNDTVDIDLNSYDYKIVTYVDSTGCTPCRMKLKQWNDVIDEFKKISDVNIGIFMIIQPQDRSKVIQSLRGYSYLHPIVIDENGSFESLNELPSKTDMHTFLLDADNNVIGIGNPVLNPKIKEIYLRMIDGQSSRNDMSEKLLCVKSVKSLGVVTPSDTIRLKYEFVNEDSIDYQVQAIVGSCDCVTASFDGELLMPKASSQVEVMFVADSIPGEFYRYVDIYFKEKETPERLILYGYIITN